MPHKYAIAPTTAPFTPRRLTRDSLTPEERLRWVKLLFEMSRVKVERERASVTAIAGKGV